MSQLSIDEVKVDRAVSKALNREAVFSPKFGSAARFSLQRKEGWSICPPFRSTSKNFPTFLSNSNDFCFTTGAYNFPPHPVTVLSTTAPLEINISDHSNRRVQSKISFKNITLSPRPHPCGKPRLYLAKIFKLMFGILEQGMVAHLHLNRLTLLRHILSFICLSAGLGLPWEYLFM